MEKTILTVFGTRPEAIKLCPLIRELRARKEIRCRVCVTGQHRHMVEPILSLFEISPDSDLAIMREGQDLFDVTSAALTGLREVLLRERPDLVLVHGDTTTAFAAALACFYLKIPVAHVEAGLRTYDLSAPFPEEWNRRAIALLAAYHFAPTERAKENLLREGVSEKRVSVTGNTALDALRTTVCSEFEHPILDWAGKDRLILMTAHRREALGEPMRRMFRGIRRALGECSDVKLVYPVHPNPAVRAVAREELGDCSAVRLLEPLEVEAFHNILARCYLVLTDSGGIQEEAAALHKPILLMRNETERREGLETGGLRLVGTAEGTVYRGLCGLLTDPALYDAMRRAPCPYGDGYACRRIADEIEEFCERGR